MSGYLLDTNIPSELTRPSPESSVDAFVRRYRRETMFLSVLSLGEIHKGLASLPLSRRRADLEAWLERTLRPWFADRLLPVTVPIAERWGILVGEARQKGRSFPVIDGLIAATALEHDLTLVTRNVRDYQGLGVRLLNPWEES